MGELGTIVGDELTGYQMSSSYSNCMGINSTTGIMEHTTYNVPEYISMVPSYPTNNGYTYSPESTLGHPTSLLSIVEQPGGRIRFRYQSERGSHGGMFGRNNRPEKKTYPTVKLINYDPNQKVLIRASLCTDMETPIEHVHKLQGKSCDPDRGYCTIPLGDDGICSFQGLGISFTAKKEVKGILLKRLKEHNDCKFTPEGEKTMNDTAEAQSKTMQAHMNTVRILFEAMYNDNNTVFAHIYSDTVNNQKSSESGELKITRLSKCSGYCGGDEEVFLLCEKVNKKEIKVRFFDIDGPWEAFGTFSDSDVHHQVAIVFRTPPYHKEIDKPVTVQLQLFRPKDNEISEAKDFIYRPNEHDPQHIERKKRRLGDYEDYSHDPESSPRGNYGSPSGGTGPSNSFAANPHSSFFGHVQGGAQQFQQRSRLNSYGESSSIDEIFDPSISPVQVFETSNLFSDIIEGQMDNTSSLKTDSILKSPSRPSSSVSSLIAQTQSLNLNDKPQTKSMEPSSSIEKKQDEMQRLIGKESVGSKSTPSRSVLDVLETLGHSMQLFAKTGDPRAFLSPMRHLIGKTDKNGDNALHLAVIHQSENDRLFQHLLYAHNSIENREFMAINYTNNEFQTPLHLAVVSGKPSLVSLLLLNGAKPGIQDRNGNTAVHLAIIKKHADILTILLNKQSYAGSTFTPDFLNSRNFAGNTALHLAVELKQSTQITKLVDSGADVNLGDGTSGRTPLHLAVELYHDMVPCLLKQMQIDINKQDYAGNTPLHSACEQMSIELSLQLMELEANPLIENFVQSENQDTTTTTNSCSNTTSDPNELRGITPFDIAGGNTELCNVLAGQISPSLKRKISQARKLSTQESLVIIDSERERKISYPIEREQDERSKLLAPTDSGYASGKVEGIPEDIISKLCEVLDPPCAKWELLYDILICEKTHISNMKKLYPDSSPTRALIQLMEKQEDFNIETLRNALEAADLKEELKLLDSQ